MEDIKRIVNLIHKHRGDKIEIPNELMSEYGDYFNMLYKQSGNSARASSKRTFFHKNVHRIHPKEYSKLKTFLDDVYVNRGLGLKRIGKMLDVTYSNMRTLFSIMGIELRDSNVVTDSLRECRSENLKKKYETRDGWFKSLERRTHTTNKGVQGYYYNQSKQKYVWLRSTYEYIYAKFLDTHNIDWDVEICTFELNNTTYRPDFFIYDSSGELNKIVEIKGYWKTGERKTTELNEIIDIDVIIIGNIKPYIESNSNYTKELKQWKKTRKLKESELKK